MGCRNSYEKMPELRWPDAIDFENQGYYRLTASGLSRQSAIDNLSVLCLKKGVEKPQKHGNGNLYCGTAELSCCLKTCKVYNPVFCLKRAQTYFSFTHFIPV